MKIPKNPCYNEGHDCVTRSQHCRPSCEKWMQYVEEKQAYDEHIRRAKMKDGKIWTKAEIENTNRRRRK